MHLRSVLFAILFLAPALAFSGIAGHYKMYGIRPDSSKYHGTAVIHKTGNDVYSVTWTFDDNTSETGTGVRKGDWISFAFDEGEGHIGTIMYKIDDHLLKGRYVMLGSTKYGVEKLKKT